MKLCTFGCILVLALVLSASFSTQAPVPCAACKHKSAILIPNLPSTIRAACGRPLPGGGTCQVERRKNFYKCNRPECGEYSRGNASSKVEDCIHHHKEHIQGPFENPTILSSFHRLHKPRPPSIRTAAGATGLSAATTGQYVPPKRARTSAHQCTEGVPKKARTSSELDTM
ncbi:hypothetical protein PTTG_29702 [Puccinia triticina 1-1 BBBD Race 1]|uniref:C2H2-type domain-containing protein n=1 Tax=Puccinia triticina (isolate 1-1 / race 1 (BBBD)) TaxID=630390 RepID=A0A180G4Q7_PUCT1|nr:hypothetical protein PTTG_29702 [Puccinia triticina 1-1 BBBD Race 1]WAR59730.1 hypothetical protein PtB15_11B370 [Puccinia triticina]